MSPSSNSDAADAAATSDQGSKLVDPKEQMRLALERKKAASHHDSARLAGGSKLSGGAHKQQGGKREFRRKSGG